MRGKIPTSDVSWPAWWALGVNVDTVSWPKCGEIDMMEYYRKIILANVMDSQEHWTLSKDPLPDGWSDHFHTWVMEWDSTRIKLFRDDVLKVSYPVDNATVNGYNPFRQKMFMRLNLAIGGNMGGDPSKTIFPLDYYADYVRVYQWR